MNRHVVLAVATSLLTGCATRVSIPPPPPSAEQAAADFTARSLRDAGLHRFLAENLGRDPGEAWDVESLTWAAFYLHPSLELARAQWASARAAEQVAGARPNPTLTLTPGYNFTREAGLSPWMPAVNFDFLFPTAGKRKIQEAIARDDAEAARLSVLSAAWQVRTDLRRALVEAAIAGKREAQLRTQAGVQRSLLSLLKERQEAGGVAATEVSVAQTALLRAEFSADDAHGQLLAARAHIASALGITLTALGDTPLPAPVAAERLTADAIATARRTALQARADVLSALARYRSAHAAVGLEVAKQVPDFHLGPGYQWDQGANKWTLGISLELPLFHRNEAGIVAALARRAEAAAQFNAAQAQVIAAIDLAVAAQESAQAQLQHAQQLEAEIRQQNDRVQQRIDLGAADQVELQAARLDLATAASAVLDAENAAALAAGQLEDAFQLPFPHLAALAAVSTSPAHTHE
jgi:cobalt-zinc-cadmium efflux system outer membrane protein